MLNLTALRKLLSAVLSPPRLHTAILFTPAGDIVAHATTSTPQSKDKLRVLAGLASEVWLEVSGEGLGMVESELGKILVLPLFLGPSSSASRLGRSSSHSLSANSTLETQSSSECDPPLLIALNGADDVEWTELKFKAQGVVDHLSGPLFEYGDRLLSSPPRNRILERFY